jgi:hypothetical protein
MMKNDMYGITLRWVGRSAVITAAIILAACSTEGPVGPDRGPAINAPATAPGTAASVDVVGGNRGPDLADCDSLRVPEPSALAFHAFATGVQIYRWSGSAWVFVAPSAQLFADAGGNGVVGIHSAGPTWESNSGSKVVGAVLKRCPGAPNAIPWLLLRAVSAEGPGVFARVTHIQRVNTVGGNAPAAAGTVTGETASVPYAAEYFFYRAQ